MQVGSFYGPAGLKAIRYGLRINEDMAEAIRETIAEAALLTDLPPEQFDEEAGILLFAVHELFAACHPQASAGYSRAYTYCTFASAQLQKLSRTYDSRRLLMRHLIIHRAFTAQRMDVKVSWWTGESTFHGTEPPERLLYLPSMRKVRQEKSNREMWRIVAGENAGTEIYTLRYNLAVALLNFSPLTRMLYLGSDVQHEFGFSLMLPLKASGKRMSPLFALDDPRMARLVVDQALEVGVERSGVMLSLALLEGVRQGYSPLAQRRAGELCVHLFLMMCWIEAHDSGASESDMLRRLITGQPVDGQKTAVFWAVVNSMISLDGVYLELPSIDRLPAPVRQLWESARAQMKQKSISVIEEALTRELKRRMPGLRRTKGYQQEIVT